MKEQLTEAELVLHGQEVMVETMRESTILCFDVITDGWLAQQSKRAFEVIHFFERETDPEMWEQLRGFIDQDTLQPDPLTGAPPDPLAVKSLAETWFEKWQALVAATGQKQKVAAK